MKNKEHAFSIILTLTGMVLGGMAGAAYAYNTHEPTKGLIIFAFFIFVGYALGLGIDEVLRQILGNERFNNTISKLVQGILAILSMIYVISVVIFVVSMGYFAVTALLRLFTGE